MPVREYEKFTTTAHPIDGARRLNDVDTAVVDTRSKLLSAEDVRILGLVAEGHQIDVIAQRLNFSPRTVRRRLREMCDCLGARAPIQIAVWAARSGLI